MAWRRAVAFAGLVALAGCSARDEEPGGGGGGGETSADACSDGRDNDGDGLTDCAEPACTVHAWCGGGTDAGGAVDGGGAGADSGPRPDGGPGCAEPLDVVFVIDVSTSMADEVEQIR